MLMTMLTTMAIMNTWDDEEGSTSLTPESEGLGGRAPEKTIMVIYALKSSPSFEYALRSSSSSYEYEYEYAL